MTVRLNHGQIFKGAGDGDLLLFAIPDAYRRALLGVSESLNFSATWVGDDGRRVAISDAEQAILDVGRDALMEVEHVDKIVAELQNINATLQTIASNGSGGAVDDLGVTLTGLLAGLDPKLATLLLLLDSIDDALGGVYEP